MRRCAFCKRDIPDDDRNVFQEVTGWQRPGRGASGLTGSSIVLRQVAPGVAHATCIQRARMGLHPQQDPLWSE